MVFWGFGFIALGVAALVGLPIFPLILIAFGATLVVHGMANKNRTHSGIWTNWPPSRHWRSPFEAPEGDGGDKD